MNAYKCLISKNEDQQSNIHHSFRGEKLQRLIFKYQQWSNLKAFQSLKKHIILIKFQSYVKRKNSYEYEIFHSDIKHENFNAAQSSPFLPSGTRPCFIHFLWETRLSLLERRASRSQIAQSWPLPRTVFKGPDRAYVENYPGKIAGVLAHSECTWEICCNILVEFAGGFAWVLAICEVWQCVCVGKNVLGINRDVGVSVVWKNVDSI